MKHYQLLVLVSVVAAFGCAQTKVYTPQVTPTRVELSGLPASIVTVEINDLRAEKNHSDALAAVLRSQVESALTRSPAPEGATRHRLVIDVVEHRSYFTSGTWNASTRLRARLIRSDGSLRGQWEGSGSGRRSNMWGYHDAKAVSQDAYNNAVSDLLSALTAASIVGQD